MATMESNFQIHRWSKKSFLKILYNSEAIARMCSINKLFLKILRNLQEKTFVGASFLIKLQTPFFHKISPVAASDYCYEKIAVTFI